MKGVKYGYYFLVDLLFCGYCGSGVDFVGGDLFVYFVIFGYQCYLGIGGFVGGIVVYLFFVGDDFY